MYLRKRQETAFTGTCPITRPTGEVIRHQVITSWMNWRSMLIMTKTEIMIRKQIKCGMSYGYLTQIKTERSYQRKLQERPAMNYVLIMRLEKDQV